LLIIGVAEPIVLVYMYMYKFAKDRDDLGSRLFLPWAAWVCVWTGVLVMMLAVTNACLYISKFTRYAGEAFGLLIAMLFLQQAIKGTVEEYRRPATADAGYKLANGLWSTILAIGLLLTALLVRTARHWRFLRSPLRSFLADYGVPLLVIVWGGIGYIVRGPPGASMDESIPTQVDTPNTWEMSNTWSVAAKMGDVPGEYIAGALIPGLIIAILFYFDHNVSSQLAQQQEFNLQKPSAFHWDMLLLGIMAVGLGLVGLPPVNGVIPQSPMHTKALAKVSNRKPRPRANLKEVDAQQHASLGPDPAVNGVADDHLSDENGIPPSFKPPLDGAASASHHLDVPTLTSAFAASAPGSNEEHTTVPLPSPSVTHSDDSDVAVEFSVAEQRWSNLGQGLAVGALLAATPAIRLLPTAVLWGYFAFMALESLPGSQLWDRTLLLLTDPKRRYTILEHTHAPYLETVRMPTIARFTLLQLAIVGGIYGLTWAGIAGVLFPIPIMALVPIRQYALPRMFSPAALSELDAIKEEAAPPLPHELALSEAAGQGLSPAVSFPSSAQAIVDEGEILDAEITARYNRVLHHPSHSELVRRRASMEGGGRRTLSQDTDTHHHPV
jgi:boron transporter